MERMEHNSSIVMWWSPHNSLSIQQMLLGITAVQVTTLWLYWSTTRSCTTQSTNISLHQSTTGKFYLMITTLWFVTKFCSFCFSFFNLSYPSPNNTAASPYLLRKHSYTQINCSPSAVKKPITACLECTSVSAVMNQVQCCHLSKQRDYFKMAEDFQELHWQKTEGISIWLSSVLCVTGTWGFSKPPYRFGGGGGNQCCHKINLLPCYSVHK